MHLRCKAKDDHGNSCYIKVDGRPIQAPWHQASYRGYSDANWRLGVGLRNGEIPNIPVTIDLEPGIRELTFSPREPQQIDRIVLRRGPIKGACIWWLEGEGPEVHAARDRF